jgi:hypothetical protein
MLAGVFTYSALTVCAARLRFAGTSIHLLAWSTAPITRPRLGVLGELC